MLFLHVYVCVCSRELGYKRKYISYYGSKVRKPLIYTTWKSHYLKIPMLNLIQRATPRASRFNGIWALVANSDLILLKSIRVPNKKGTGHVSFLLVKRKQIINFSTAKNYQLFLANRIMGRSLYLLLLCNF